MKRENVARARPFLTTRLTDNPFSEALLAVVIGLFTSILFSAFNEIFYSLDAPFIVSIIWWVIPVVEFFAGISGSIVSGFVYSLSLVFFGVQMGEWGLILTGVIAFSALVAGYVIRKFSRARTLE
jgi:hypothetical protein